MFMNQAARTASLSAWAENISNCCDEHKRPLRGDLINSICRELQDVPRIRPLPSAAARAAESVAVLLQDARRTCHSRLLQVLERLSDGGAGRLELLQACKQNALLQRQMPAALDDVVVASGPFRSSHHIARLRQVARFMRDAGANADHVCFVALQSDWDVAAEVLRFQQASGGQSSLSFSGFVSGTAGRSRHAPVSVT
jgi:hypothetical protein